MYFSMLVTLSPRPSIPLFTRAVTRMNSNMQPLTKTRQVTIQTSKKET